MWSLAQLLQERQLLVKELLVAAASANKQDQHCRSCGRHAQGANPAYQGVVAHGRYKTLRFTLQQGAMTGGATRSIL